MGNSSSTTQRFTYKNNNTNQSRISSSKEVFEPKVILHEFREISKNPFFSIVKHTSSDAKAFRKNLYDPARNRTDDEIEIIITYMQKQSPTIQRCFGYARVNDDALELFCKYNTGYKQVFSYFEFFAPEFSLDAVIAKRKETMNYFTELQLWLLMKQVLLSIMHLEFIDCFHPDLKPLNIYLSPYEKDTYKISNPFLNDFFLDFMVGYGQKNYWGSKVRKVALDGRKVIDPNVFLAKKKYAKKFRKQNLIRLSLILLSAATFTPFFKFYINADSFNFLGIEKNFQEIQSRYSAEFVWTLKFLFTIDDIKWKDIRKNIVNLISFVQENTKIDFNLQPGYDQVQSNNNILGSLGQQSGGLASSLHPRSQGGLEQYYLNNQKSPLTVNALDGSMDGSKLNKSSRIFK